MNEDEMTTTINCRVTQRLVLRGISFTTVAQFVKWADFLMSNSRNRQSYWPLREMGRHTSRETTEHDRQLVASLLVHDSLTGTFVTLAQNCAASCLHASVAGIQQLNRRHWAVWAHWKASAVWSGFLITHSHRL